MANLIIPPRWHLPEKEISSERSFLSRRSFFRQFGILGSASLIGAATGMGTTTTRGADTSVAPSGKLPAPRNPKFDGPNSSLTDEAVASHYNNFYEFSTSKERVAREVERFQISPWTLEVTGLCENPMKLDASELTSQFPLEERVYRFRCVEAWAMVVPWTGFPLAKLLQKARPKSEAKFVRFVSTMVPKEMPGIARLAGYPWPYTEGLRMDEAMNELVLVATGIYGKPLPKQHGAPVRIVVPWKYGYKGAKSIVKIEFTTKQPNTLWESLAPDEYPFESNVDPGVPHPRWSQASERMIDSGDRVPTKKYNGYGDWVASLYSK
jgi:sulfoxide reductase catalytic subunit YedY